MSIKTRMRKQQAVGIKTGRDATPILPSPVVIKQATRTSVKSVLPLLTERIEQMFADVADWETFVATTKQFCTANEPAA